MLGGGAPFETGNLMRLRFWNLFVLAAAALAAPAAYAAWSHHPTSSTSSAPTPPIPVNPGSTTVTTTSTLPSGFTSTIQIGTAITLHNYLAAGTNEFGVGTPTFAVQTVTPPSTSTTTTTVSSNANGSTTTTKTTTVTAAGPQQTTTTLANAPNPNAVSKTITIDIPGYPQSRVTGVTASQSTTATGASITITGTINGGVTGGRPLPFNLTETVATISATPALPSVTQTSSTTMPIETIFPRGSFGATEQPETVAFEDVEAEVKAASDAAQAAIAACGVETPSCVADALDAYADALEKLAPRLPPRLRTLPGIIRNASHKIRIAKTPAEAVRAVKAAIVAVHKTISLLRADDATTRQVGAREGALVVETLQVASNKLEKAVGL